MPSDKHNSITAKAMDLIFFTVRCREMPFGIPQYIQCILYVLLCVPFIFVTAKNVDSAVAHDGFPS